jgi:hypothetical protein
VLELTVEDAAILREYLEDSREIQLGYGASALVVEAKPDDEYLNQAECDGLVLEALLEHGYVDEDIAIKLQFHAASYLMKTGDR